MGAPPRDVQLLALFLSVSGLLSLLLGALVMRWAGGKIGSLRLRLVVAYGVGLLIALANVLTTSALMFLSAHDLTLLLLLLAFAAVTSLAFAFAVANMLTTELGVLSQTAARLAGGDLGARVSTHGSDEVAQVAAAFDHMADQLQAAFERERTLEAGRRELVSAVSHDLRTPLATTRAMVEALADGVVTDPTDVQRYLQLIRREIQHLSRLIDDLFELSQIESGTLHLRLMPVDLGQFVAEMVAAYQTPAADRGIRLEDALGPDVDATRIDADPDRLQRILRNLLDNALRYTPSGGIVRVDARSVGVEVELSVSDSGPGIPPEQREQVFERFYQSERSRRRGDAPGDGGTSTGAGLGLAIARGLVRAHHGRMWAEPSPLGGASLRFTLPRVGGAPRQLTAGTSGSEDT